MSQRGRFITLEGGEGAGKSTQVKRLVALLQGRGISVIATREPGGCEGAEDIRGLWLARRDWDPMTELLLVMAARREHLSKTVLPALKRGTWVVSDRYVDSSRAYQGFAMGLGVEKVDAIYKEVAGDFWPDLTLFLDIDVETGLARVKARAEALSRYDSKEVSFHERLRAAYLHLAKAEPKRFRLINAARSEEKVAEQIEKTLAGLIDAALM